jgi:hypothetical protein
VFSVHVAVGKELFGDAASKMEGVIDSIVVVDIKEPELTKPKVCTEAVRTAGIALAAFLAGFGVAKLLASQT